MTPLMMPTVENSFVEYESTGVVIDLGLPRADKSAWVKKAQLQCGLQVTKHFSGSWSAFVDGTVCMPQTPASKREALPGHKQLPKLLVETKRSCGSAELFISHGTADWAASIVSSSFFIQCQVHQGSSLTRKLISYVASEKQKNLVLEACLRFGGYEQQREYVLLLQKFRGKVLEIKGDMVRVLLRDVSGEGRDVVAGFELQKLQLHGISEEGTCFFYTLSLRNGQPSRSFELISSSQESLDDSKRLWAELEAEIP